MGRGRSKAGGGAGGLGGGGLGGLGGGLGLAGGPPPQVTPGQPVPAITQAQLQAMDDQQFAAYLNGLASTPIDQLTYYNHDWSTQRLIANMPELNMAPQLVDAQTFASLPGEALYRTVNATGRDSALDICGRTMTSDVTTIGAGRMGDGFYFDTTLAGSQVGYGKTIGNIQKTATMRCKLNSNARVVDEARLKTMLGNESPGVRNAILNMSGGGWTYSGLTAYALRKGYNVVRGGSYTNVIDRNAATWSMQVVDWK